VSEIRRATLDELSPATLYRILELRSRVFVLEQDCAFLEPDGRDLEPTTVHWWIEQSGAVVSYLRVLGQEVGHELGRVVTDPAWRSKGLGRMLIDRALAGCGRPVILKGQSRLVPWYATFGFVVSGPEFDEDGQPHTPMRLT
jgi:ElaA protein